MDLRPRTFWPIPRQMINDDAYGDFRSLLTFQLLFGGRLVIRDSDYVVCRPLRQAVSHCLAGGKEDDQQFLWSLVRERHLTVARREGGSLSATAANRLKSGWIQENADWILRFDDTDFIDEEIEATTVDTFSLTDAAQYYTTSILRFLEGDLAGGISADLQRGLLDGARQMRERNGTLAWANFSLDGEVWDLMPTQPSPEKRNFVFEVLGQAPHAGFIPDHLGISPIYMNDVAGAVALWRGRLAKGELQDTQSTTLGSGRFSFSDYAECLRLLSLSDIIKLVTSPEAEGYFHVAERFAARTTGAQDLIRAHYAYRHRIDEQIARRVSANQPDRAELVSIFGRKVGEKAVEECLTTVFELINAPALLWKPGLALFQAIAGRRSEQGAVDTERQGAVVDMVKLMSRLQDSGTRMEHEVYSARDGVDRRVDVAANDLQIS